MSDTAVTQTELTAAFDKLETRLLSHTDRSLEKLETRLLEHTERTRIELLEHTERVETTLLREFRKWAISFESRFKAIDTLVVGFNERLISVEE